MWNLNKKHTSGGFPRPHRRELSGVWDMWTRRLQGSGREAEGEARAERPCLSFQSCPPLSSISNLQPGRLFPWAQGSPTLARIGMREWGYHRALVSHSPDSNSTQHICSQLPCPRLQPRDNHTDLAAQYTVPTSATLSLLTFLQPPEQLPSPLPYRPPSSSGSSLSLHFAPSLAHTLLPTCQSPRPCHHLATYISLFSQLYCELPGQEHSWDLRTHAPLAWLRYQ